MSFSAQMRRAPTRLATGAFTLDSGLAHLKADHDTAAELHDMAVGAYPFLAKVDPRLFTTALAVGEIAVGGLLLAPIVPAGLAGLALTGLAGGLIGLYARTPGLRREGSVFPTQQGLPFAKDSWLAAIGISLLADAILTAKPAEQSAHAGRPVLPDGGNTMSTLPRAEVLRVMHRTGHFAQVAEAERILPDQVDLDRDWRLLEDLGLYQGPSDGRPG